MKQFDTKLYKEGLRQLTLTGVVCSVLLVIEGFLLPLFNLISIYDSRGAEHAVVQINLFNPLLAAIPYVMPMLMVMVLFRFLNNRSGSDMYHSMPQTRVCVALSFLAAVATWVLGVLWIGTLLSGLFTDLLPTSTVLWGASMKTLLRETAACLLAISGTFLAVSVTGTVFTNLAATVMVLYLPALLELVVQLNVENQFSWVSSLKNLFPYHYNTFISAYGSWAELLGEKLDVGGLTVSVIYTMLLAVLIGAVGLYTFHKRKSEAAGQPASHPVLKAIFRVLPAYTFTLIPISIIFNVGVETAEDWFLMLMLFVIAVIIYLLYELFSTGKWKSVVKSFKGLWLLAVLDVAMLIILAAMTAYIRFDVPKAEEIDSVSIESEGFIGRYYDDLTEGIRFTDDEIKEVIADALQDTVGYWEGGDYNYIYRKNVDVVIRSGWKVLYRSVMLDSVNAAKLDKLLGQSEQYRTTLMTLPDPKEWELMLWMDWRYRMSDKDQAEIHELLQREVQEMGFERWYAILEGEDSSQPAFHVEYVNSIEGTGLSIPISKRNFPKTFAKAMTLIQTTDTVEDDLIDAMTRDEEQVIGYTEMDVRLVELESGEEVVNEWFSCYSKEMIAEMDPVDRQYYYTEEERFKEVEALLADIFRKGSTDAAEYMLYLNYYADARGSWTVTGYLMSEEDAQKLMELSQNDYEMPVEEGYEYETSVGVSETIER